MSSSPRTLNLRVSGRASQDALRLHWLLTTVLSTNAWSPSLIAASLYVTRHMLVGSCNEGQTFTYYFCSDLQRPLSHHLGDGGWVVAVGQNIMTELSLVISLLYWHGMTAAKSFASLQGMHWMELPSAANLANGWLDCMPDFQAFCLPPTASGHSCSAMVKFGIASARCFHRRHRRRRWERHALNNEGAPKLQLQ